MPGANVTESQRIDKPAIKPSMRPVIFLIVVFGAWLALTTFAKWRMPRELVPWQSDLAAAMITGASLTIDGGWTAW